MKTRRTTSVPIEVTLPRPAKVPRDSRLKVLLVSLFHPELVRGGAQQVCYEVFEGLSASGEVEPYLLASVDRTYPALYKAGARITGFDGKDRQFLYLSADYDYWWHKTSSELHIEAISDFLLSIEPEIVHFHHFLTIGIDVVSLVRRILPNAKIVFTFHEFLTICAADGHMVRKTDGSLCTHAGQVRCHQCFPQIGPEQFHMRKLWFMRHLAQVDAFTCPSRFMMAHFAEWGIDPARIRCITNGQTDLRRNSFVQSAPGPKKRFGFFGQFVDVKGVHILLRAVAILRAEGFIDFVVELNGENIQFASPQVRTEIEAFLAKEGELPVGERLVTHNGGYHQTQLGMRMARVDWCIVPSIWWEIFCLVISEAWMFGKPVLCSNVGGPAERVADGVDGLHFELGDARALAATMRRAATEDGLWERLAANLPTPPARETMVSGYRRLYDDVLAGGAVSEAA